VAAIRGDTVKWKFSYRPPPKRRIVARWHWWALYFLCAFTLLPFVSMMILVERWRIAAPPFPGTYLRILVNSGMTIGCVTLIFLVTALPLIEASNARFARAPRPRRERRALIHGLVLTCWGPALVLFFPVWTAYELAGDWWRNFEPPLNNPDQRLLWIALATPFLVAWCYWFSRVVWRRCRRAMRDRSTCFRCGYDLRHNPWGACPECGHQDKAAPVDRAGGPPLNP